MADSLAAAGIRTIACYPAGRHAVDVCAGDADRFVGLDCAVHPDGALAHVQRHLALRRAGWTVVGVHRSRWGERRGSWSWN